MLRRSPVSYATSELWLVAESQAVQQLNTVMHALGYCRVRGVEKCGIQEMHGVFQQNKNK